MILDVSKASLLMIDVQEKFIPVLSDKAQVLRNGRILLETAQTLALPLTISEQYKKGLGATVADFQDYVQRAQFFEKMHFSCWRDLALKNHFIALYEGGRPQVIIAGVETHVCVLQTAIDMAQAGFSVYVVADATSSRRTENHAMALGRMAGQSIQIVSTESVLFELLGQAGSKEFKALSALIR